jgi:RimJ/RimL family protein N-acetyltransferase
MDSLQRALLLNIPERIECERLTLHAIKSSDGPEVFEAVQESVNELTPWMPWVHPEPKLDDTIVFHANGQMKWYSREMLDFQWREKSTGRLVGKGGFHTINWAVPKFEIGYWVRTSMTGKGYCTEAVNALVQFARNELGAKRLEICNDPKNIRSRAVAERCGFTLEGTLIRNMRDPYGALRDSCMYAKVFE